MVRIDSITEEDTIKYKDIFIKADILGMTLEEAVKIVDGERERILFVCGPIWMLFGYKNDGLLEYHTFMVNDNDDVVSFTKDDFQVNVGENIIYLIYENGRHESLQFLKDSNTPDFEVSSNGLVVHMQYNPKKDVRCVSKFEHCAYGDCSRIYDMRLSSPFEVSIESKVSKRDKGLKFLGSKNAYYRLDFDVRNNKWQYDLATIQEFGLNAVMANDTISLHSGIREFSKYYKVLFSVGSYITITGFPFLQQYNQKDIEEYMESYDFSVGVSEKIVDIYNNKKKYLDIFQDIVVLYKSRILYSTPKRNQ